MKYLILLFVLFTMPAMACDINTYGQLSDADAQELKVLCEQKKAAALKAGTTPSSASITEAVDKIDKDTIAKIGAISDAIVSAVTGIARGLGVEVNEFIKTPAGILVAGILIFYLVGAKLLGIVLIFLIAGFSHLLLARAREALSDGETTVKEIPGFRGWYTRIVSTTKRIPFSQWEKEHQKEYLNTCTLLAVINIVSSIAIVLVIVNN